MPNKSQASVLSSSLTLGEKYIRDLSKLTFCPDSKQNLDSTFEIAPQASFPTLLNNIILSANRRWENPKLSQDALRGTQAPSTHFCLMR